MKYTVVWAPAALMELATIWNDAEDRGAVAAASDEIDRELGKPPNALGESRGSNARILFMGPLAIDFEVVEDDCLVTVLTVWRPAGD